MLMVANNLAAQSGEDFISQTRPYPTYRTPQTQQYNLKWGKLTGRLHGAVNLELNDNINLSENNPQADISIGPEAGIGFLYPITENNILQLDLTFGYRWYLNSPSVSTFVLAPRNDSHLDFFVYFENGRLNFHDTFGVQSDAVDFGALTGAAGNLSAFRRFVNTSGVTADWRPVRDWTFYVGYDYILDRSLTADFTQFDQDTHAFSAGFNYAASPRLTLGGFAAYSLNIFRQRIQNNGNSLTIGPRVSYQITRFVVLEASAGYTVAGYDNSGSIADTASFGSFTYQVGIRHNINKVMNHDLRFGRSLGQGFGSNFTDTWSVQYGYSWRITPGIALGATIAYEDYVTSNASEHGQRYLFNLGTNYRLTRLWSIGVAYTLSRRDSDVAGNDYVQNRLTMHLNRQF